MAIYKCEIRKADCALYAEIAVFCESADEVEAIIHTTFGDHLAVSSIAPLEHGRCLQIGGGLIAVASK